MRSGWNGTCGVLGQGDLGLPVLGSRDLDPLRVVADLLLVGRVEPALVLVDDQAEGRLPGLELARRGSARPRSTRRSRAGTRRCRPGSRPRALRRAAPSRSTATIQRTTTTHLLRRPVTIDASALNETSCRVERRLPLEANGGARLSRARLEPVTDRVGRVARSARIRSTEASKAARSSVAGRRARWRAPPAALRPGVAVDVEQQVGARRGGAERDLGRPGAGRRAGRLERVGDRHALEAEPVAQLAGDDRRATARRAASAPPSAG